MFLDDFDDFADWSDEDLDLLKNPPSREPVKNGSQKAAGCGSDD